MSIFEKLEINYAAKFAALDVNNFTAEEKEIIHNYQTPNGSYISPSSRGLSYEDVDYSVLGYILTTCYKCKPKERYQAALVTLYKLGLDDEISVDVENAKSELLEYLSDTPTKTVVDLSFLDTLTLNYEGGFFYLVELTIGRNKILKYGITEKNPRYRFVQIKSDIKSNYAHQAVVVTPYLVLHCIDNRKFEDEIKSLLLENDIYTSNYSFKGSSETFRQKHLHTVITLIALIVKEISTTTIYSVDGIPTIDEVCSEDTLDESVKTPAIAVEPYDIVTEKVIYCEADNWPEPPSPDEADRLNEEFLVHSGYYERQREESLEEEYTNLGVESNPTKVQRIIPPGKCNYCGNEYVNGECGGADCI